MLDTIIIVPYRNRKEQFTYFVNNAVPKFKKLIPNSQVIFIEQDWTNKLFNRGCLLNIGVKEFEGKTKYIITHDIDIIPTEETITKYYIDPIQSDTIKGIYTSMCNTLGGIVKIPIKTYFDINGFPNDIWGWGGEDFAIQRRAEYFNKRIEKNILSNDPKQKDYLIRFDNVNDRVKNNNDINIRRYNLNNMNEIQKKNNITSSGMNNLSYKILKRNTINDYIVIIKVEI